MEKVFVALVSILLIVVMAPLLGMVLAFPVMWLWNWICPILFDLPSITYWQSWGLFFLCALLFKGVYSSSS